MYSTLLLKHYLNKLCCKNYAESKEIRFRGVPYLHGHFQNKTVIEVAMQNLRIDPTLSRTVRVRYTIVSVSSIDMVNQRFSCEAIIDFIIKSPELSEKSAKELQANNFALMNSIFCPVFMNITQEDSREVFLVKDSVSSDEIRMSFRLKGVFLERMELQQFPFDDQDLSIRITPRQTLDQIHFEKMEEEPDRVLTDTETAFIVPDWFLANQAFSKVTVTDMSKSATKRIYSEYHLTIIVRRRFHYYLWNVYFIFFLIITSSGVVYSIQGSKTTGPATNRLNFMVKLLLATVAFKYSTSNIIPKVAYNTPMDYYVLGGFVVLVSVMTECAIVDHYPQIAALDKSILSAIGFFWICFNLGHVVRAFEQTAMWTLQDRRLTEEQHSQDTVIPESQTKGRRILKKSSHSSVAPTPRTQSSAMAD